MSGMDAVIVAGGFGTRVWPLTARHPKHLLPVAGVPFVLHQISKLAASGVDHVVLATSYLAEAFEPVLGDGAALGVRLSYVTETEPLGTGGAIRNVLPALTAGPNDPVLVLNGDQLSGHDAAAQVHQWRALGADVSLQLIEVPDARAYGCVPTDDAGRVTAFLEKSADPVTRQVNAGCYVFRRSVIEEIPPAAVVSVERETFPSLLRAGRLLVGYAEPCYWLDVGTPAAVAQASRDLVTGAVTTPAYGRGPAERLIHPSARVDPSATVGRGASIGPDTTIGPGAVVEGSVVMPGATVAEGATVIDTVVGAGASIGAGTVLRDAALGDDAVVGERCELLAGARLGCAARIEDEALRFSEL